MIQIVSILLVAVAFAPALAHVLEFPGKRRLNKEAYLTVQPIYYPVSLLREASVRSVD